MKKSIIFVAIVLASGALFLNTQGFNKAQDSTNQAPSEALYSSIFINLSVADQDDYAHVEYRATTIDSSQTEPGEWYYVNAPNGNVYFDSNGSIAIPLYYQFGFIETRITVHMNDDPDCPYYTERFEGERLSTIMVSLYVNLNSVYPWECPE